MTHLNVLLKKRNRSRSAGREIICIFSTCTIVVLVCFYLSSCVCVLLFFFSIINMKVIPCDVVAGDAVSECGTSYYSEYDPFDYLYSSVTQYSDPMYEAVVKHDKTPISSQNNDLYIDAHAMNRVKDLSQIDEQLDEQSLNLPDWDARSDELSDFTIISPATAPPLPPRNPSRQSSFSDVSKPTVDRSNKTSVDRLKVPLKLYENVIENKTYDAELLAFYNMVSIKFGKLVRPVHERRICKKKLKNSHTF